MNLCNVQHTHPIQLSLSNAVTYCGTSFPGLDYTGDRTIKIEMYEGSTGDVNILQNPIKAINHFRQMTILGRWLLLQASLCVST